MGSIPGALATLILLDLRFRADFCDSGQASYVLGELTMWTLMPLPPKRRENPTLFRYPNGHRMPEVAAMPCNPDDGAEPVNA
jgi:hypothetical protein